MVSLLQTGSFSGHLVPGIFFIVFGGWWCLNSIMFHFKRKKKRKASSNLHASGNLTSSKVRQGRSASQVSFSDYRNDLILARKSWIPTFFLPRVPLEPFLKIMLAVVGIIVEEFLKIRNHHVAFEVYHIRDADGGLQDVGKLYHITLYAGFLLSGIVDLVTLCLKFPFPTSTVFFGLSFLTEGLLFYFHTIGRDDLDTMVHLLLVFPISTCFIFALLRLYSPINIVINLCLGSSLLFQGTWLIQIGYFLFGGFVGKTESITHAHVMLTTATFSWHLLFISTGVLLFYALMAVVMNRKSFHLKSKGRRNRTGKSFQLGRKETAEEHNWLMASEESDKAANGGIFELQNIQESNT